VKPSALHSSLSAALASCPAKMKSVHSALHAIGALCASVAIVQACCSQLLKFQPGFQNIKGAESALDRLRADLFTSTLH